MVFEVAIYIYFLPILYVSFTSLEQFFKICFIVVVLFGFANYDCVAFSGPLLVTIVLVAENCGDRSCSELWRIKQV